MLKVWTVNLGRALGKIRGDGLWCVGDVRQSFYHYFNPCLRTQVIFSPKLADFVNGFVNDFVNVNGL